MYILLCRKKVMECMKGGPFDIGFVDPNRVHEEVVRTKTRANRIFLAKVFTEKTNQKEILLPYNFS